MQFTRKKVVAILVALVIVAITAYMLLPSLLQRPCVSIASYEFKVKLSGWRIMRVIEVYLENSGTDNVTISLVKVNGEEWSLWSPQDLMIKPGDRGCIEIQYPWNNDELEVSIETSGGEVKFKDKAPAFNGVKIVLLNAYNQTISELVHLEMYFKDGECKRGFIRILDDEGLEVESQMWGVVEYESGYVRTAIISFPISLRPGEHVEYRLEVGEKSVYAGTESPYISIKQTGNYTLIENGVLTVRFKEYEVISGRLFKYGGVIDYFGNQKINFAKLYEPPNSTRSGLNFFHGMLDSFFEFGYDKRYALLVKTDTWIDSRGPLLAVYARKWSLGGDRGYVYEFFGIPVDSKYILYRCVVEVNREFSVGPNPGPGAGGYEFYNPAGMGEMGVPHLAVVGATYYLIESEDIYYPPWPGVDIWIKHSIALCVDFNLGVGISLVVNDEAAPLGYWHISTTKWPWEDEYSSDMIFLAGIHENMLCYDGQNISKEPYASEREVKPRGSATYRRGVYSYLFAVRAIIGEDALTILKYMNNLYEGRILKLNVEKL